eukprot:13135199-Heterocapsa_arctica.AAC.1
MELGYDAPAVRLVDPRGDLSLGAGQLHSRRVSPWAGAGRAPHAHRPRPLDGDRPRDAMAATGLRHRRQHGGLRSRQLAGDAARDQGRGPLRGDERLD